LLNVTYNNSSTPAIERDVLQQHSYGRQIGRLMDALSVFIERLAASAKDDQRIEDFLALVKDVAQIKENARLPRLERLQKDIEALRQEDPKAYAQLKARAEGSSPLRASFRVRDGPRPSSRVSPEGGPRTGPTSART
jgi:hypothetical protein